MNDDVRRITYLALVVFLAIVVVWLGVIYVAACGISLECQRAAPQVDRTPIPTLAPATLPAPNLSRRTEFNKCEVAAADLVGAWVTAGSPEAEPFAFTDVDGVACQGTFSEDVQPLFVNSNLWYAGALACSSCHSAALLTINAGLDLSSYEGMALGSKREENSAASADIFADGDWQSSILYDWLFVRKHNPLTRPPELPAEGPVIYAGMQLAGPSPKSNPSTPTPPAALTPTTTP
jgi:hypothetical protein